MNSMQSSSTISVTPPTQGIAFKFFVVISLLVLFGLFLYAILGPLPNQSKFLTKTGTSKGLDVDGNAIITGNTTIGGQVEISGNLELKNPLYGPEFDLINISGDIGTTKGKFAIDTNGDIFTQSIGNIIARPTGSLIIKNYTGTNTTVNFDSITKQTDFYGNIILNDENGNNGLILKNQSIINPDYRLKNDSVSNNMVIESSIGSTFKNIMDATSNGNIINLMKDSTDPFLYIGSGNGRVYDNIYNPLPILQTNPTFNSITTTATATVGTNAIVNGTTTMNGSATMNGTTIMNGNTTIAPTAMFKAIGDASHEPSFGSTTFFKNGQTGSETATGRIATLTDNMMIQGQNRVTIGSYGDPEELASFDTSLPWNTSSNFSPVFNLRGYMKYTLPAYGTTGGNQKNQYIYNTNNAIPQTINGNASGWPSGSYLGQWFTTQTGPGAYLITVSGTPTAGWQCPTRGIWQVTFDSRLGTASTITLGIGNFTTSEPYGVDKVTTTVVVNKNDIILVTGQSGTVTNYGFNCRMTFSLIMELNDAKNT